MATRPRSPALALPGADTSKSITVTLAEPIVRENGNTIKELTLRKPKGGELRGLSIRDLVVGDVDSVILLLPRIAMPTIGAHEAANLESEDLADVAAAIHHFLTNRAPTKTEETP